MKLLSSTILLAANWLHPSGSQTEGFQNPARDWTWKPLHMKYTQCQDATAPRLKQCLNNMQSNAHKVKQCLNNLWMWKVHSMIGSVIKTTLNIKYIQTRYCHSLGIKVDLRSVDCSKSLCECRRNSTIFLAGWLLWALQKRWFMEAIQF